MLHYAYLMPLLPLAGFVVLLAFGRRIGDPGAGWIGTAAVAGSFVVACVMLATMLGNPESGRVFIHNYYEWIHVAGFNVSVGIQLDQLSMTMCMFITGVSMLIHLYSISYMKGDPDYSKFFIYLNLFVFSMLVLVLSDNLLVTFVGWEGVGVCSYFLVSYWFHRDSAASAGKKAFIYNRIGDVGFLLAIFLIFEKTGTLDYQSIFAHSHLLAGGAATAAVLLLFLAATGKSAQIPLFNWLPDAMEGPTPVSALIHAATMVTAGVYLLCRMSQVLELSHSATIVIATVGALTAFVAATIASTQQDIKKVLAFSTVSQIGYMILAVGSGAYIAAIFLMVCHAFYKGLLFLGAGSVIHGLSDEQDLKRMGNIRRYMKWTFWAMTAGWLCIAGVFPFSGFWSKGDVLENVYAHYKPLYAIGIITALLTAYYMTRLYSLAFGGDSRFEKEAPDGRPALHEPHESGWLMRIPLIILSIAALTAGVLDLPWVHNHSFVNWLNPIFASSIYHDDLDDKAQWVLSTIDAVIALLGIGIAFTLWRWRNPKIDQPKLEPNFLQRVWYWDDFYDTIIGRPAQYLARFSSVVVDGKVIDGAVNGVASLVKSTGSGVRKLQTGYTRHYALGIVIGTVAIVVYLLTRIWWS